MVFGKPTYSVNPGLPPHLRQTFQFDRPQSTHWREVGCKEAAALGECSHYAAGFGIEIPWSKDNAAKAEDSFRKAGYRFVTVEPRNPGHHAWWFPPEQRCLASRRAPHRVPLDKPALFSIVGGDWRGNPRGEHIALSGGNWLNELQERQSALSQKQQEG